MMDQFLQDKLFGQKQFFHNLLIELRQNILNDKRLLEYSKPKGSNAEVLTYIHKAILDKIRYDRYYKIVDGLMLPVFILYNNDLVYQELIDLYMYSIINNRSKFHFSKTLDSKLRVNYLSY